MLQIHKMLLLILPLHCDFYLKYKFFFQMDIQQMYPLFITIQNIPFLARYICPPINSEPMYKLISHRTIFFPLLHGVGACQQTAILPNVVSNYFLSAFYSFMNLSLHLEFFSVQVFFKTTFVNLFTFKVISKRAGFVISVIFLFNI